jgi:hypothetical protein
MTSPKPLARRTAVLRFLIEEFIDVPEAEGDQADRAVARFQRRAARKLLPGPKKGNAASLQQVALMGMRPAAFQQLRREVRDWLGAVVRDPRLGHKVTLQGPLDMWLYGAKHDHDTLGAPKVEGSNHDVFWFYLLQIVSRAGLSQIGVCRAPKSKRDAGQSDPALCGWTEPCGKLFVRRGTAKEFCSDRCRARVATRRARGLGDDGANEPKTIPTMRVRYRPDGREMTINVSDFDPKRHEALEAKGGLR